MNDAFIFHGWAVAAAEQIQLYGWGKWSIYPEGAAANVGLLSLVYAVFGPDPAWFIPLNAAAHTTGAVLIYRLGIRLVDGDVGRIGGFFAASCFLIAPSALQWFGQNHKDAFVIMGILLSLDAWIAVNKDSLKVEWKIFSFYVIQALVGLLIIALMRPYFVGVVVVGFFISFFVTSIWWSRMSIIIARLAVIFVLVLSTLALMAFNNKYDLRAGETVAVGAYSVDASMTGWWKAPTGAEMIPTFVDNYLKRASELRRHFIDYGRFSEAGSNIDADRQPDNAFAVLSYLPRALVVGLFSPFPSAWLERLSPPRVVGALETAGFYLAFIGTVVMFARHRSRALFSGIVFCLVLMVVLAYVHPNIGTLYRQRFGLRMFFYLIGCLGWTSFFLSWPSHLMMFRAIYNRNRSGLNRLFSAKLRPEGFIRSSAALALITVVGYVGFFFRDILIVSILGLGDQTDLFFVAMAIPMLFVTCVVVPIGDSAVSPFATTQGSSSAERVALLQYTLGHSFILVLGVSSAIFIAAPWILEIMLQHATIGDLARACSYTRWMTLIVLLSAWTVVGNAMLNSLGKVREAALGQLIAPIATLSLLLLAPNDYLLAFCVAGMLLGALGNALLVSAVLYANGFPLLPRFSSISSTLAIQKLYWGMLIISLHPTIAVPMNYAFASSVEQGSLSGWALMSKMTTLISGLVGILVSSIILPRMAFKSVISKVAEHQAYAQMGYVGAISVWWAVLFMGVGFILVEPIAQGLLWDKLGETVTTEIVAVIRVGLLQIPIVIVAAFINKMVVTKGGGRYVLVAALVGLIGNFLTNCFFVPKLGLLGVALGSLFGGVLSLFILMVYARRLTHSSGYRPSSVYALVGWLAMIAICVGLQFNIVASLCIGLIIFGVAGRRQWLQLQQYQR
jgi:putative peptidoglycan lipid II flippase